MRGSYDSSTRSISWAGYIPGNETGTITCRAGFDANSACLEDLRLRGTTTGLGQDIGSDLIIVKAPQPPGGPFLAFATARPALLMSLTRLRPNSGKALYRDAEAMPYRSGPCREGN